MRLRTRFRITTAASLGATLLLAGVVVGSVRQSRLAEEELGLARALVKEQYERALFRDDVLVWGAARGKAQYDLRTATMAALLESARTAFAGAAEQDHVRELTDLFQRSTRLFREVADRDGKGPAGAPLLPLASELRQRSLMALKMLAHDIAARARQLEEHASSRLAATQRRLQQSLILLLAAVVIVTVVNSRMASVTVERRIRTLRDGAEQVAAGNLGHRNRISGSDELAELARAFDAMTARLQASYASLESSNRELEAFSYAVSHDLRAPLRSVAGFSQAALEDYGPQLDAQGRQYLELASEAAREMGQLIDDLLGLSRVTRAEMVRAPVDLSALATSIVEELRRAEPERHVEVEVTPDLVVQADATLLHQVMENLIRNAWKFTSRHPTARIRVGRQRWRGLDAYVVADDGAGFDMAYVDKLFQPFQRLHRTVEFTGTGIGLATVRRIVRRHGGDAWAEGEVEKGTAIYFTLPIKEESHAEQGDPARGGQPQRRAADRTSLQAEQHRERPARGA
jgi:signal transduction histidine kinase